MSDNHGDQVARKLDRYIFRKSRSAGSSDLVILGNIVKPRVTGVFVQSNSGSQGSEGCQNSQRYFIVSDTSFNIRSSWFISARSGDRISPRVHSNQMIDQSVMSDQSWR